MWVYLSFEGVFMKRFTTKRQKYALLAIVAALVVIALVMGVLWLAMSSQGQGQMGKHTTPIVSATPTPSVSMPRVPPTVAPSSPADTPTSTPSTLEPTPTHSPSDERSTPTGEPIVTDRFNGYTIELPPGTQRISSHKGEWDEVRTLYKVPDKGYVETIALSADFNYRSLSEEITKVNPNAISGNFYDNFTWGGSIKGHGEAWSRVSVRIGDYVYHHFYLYTTLDGGAGDIAVIVYDQASPSKWLMKAIENADWEE